MKKKRSVPKREKKNVPFQKNTEKHFEKNVPFLCSFPFSWKERSVPSVLFGSIERNVPFLSFFSVLLKGAFHSFRSFPFFWKEHSVLSVLFRSFPFFWKERKKTEHSFWGTEKNETFRMEKNVCPSLLTGIHILMPVSTMHLMVESKSNLTEMM